MSQAASSIRKGTTLSYVYTVRNGETQIESVCASVSPVCSPEMAGILDRRVQETRGFYMSPDTTLAINCAMMKAI